MSSQRWLKTLGRAAKDAGVLLSRAHTKAQVTQALEELIPSTMDNVWRPQEQGPVKDRRIEEVR